MAGKHKAKSLSRIKQMFPEVTNVVDATESIAVEVPAYERKTGTSKDPFDCAMARSCKRKYGLDGCIISLSVAYLVKGTTATRYVVPPSLSKEIVAFDRSKKFEPGTYQLSAVTPSNRFGQYKSGPRTGETRKHAKEKGHHITQGVRRFPSRAIHKGEE